MTQHLWEAKHSYYCNQGNYFSGDCSSSYKTWAEFIEEEGDNDPDYNLLFRFDWEEGDGEDDAPSFNGDIYYRNGTLLPFWMGQRKGLYRYTSVEVCRADEPAVIEFLKSRLEHLMKLWTPLSTPAPPASP